jgi:hypothetical protein
MADLTRTTPSAPAVERFAAGHECASGLVGLARKVAESEATALGFDPHVIGMTVEFAAADLQPNRIRLMLDSKNIVVGAWPG